jgi:hypothetical protein
LPSGAAYPVYAYAPGGTLWHCCRFDVDVDPSGNQLAFHPAGHAALALVDTSRLVPVPCTYHKGEAGSSDRRRRHKQG